MSTPQSPAAGRTGRLGAPVPTEGGTAVTDAVGADLDLTAWQLDSMYRAAVRMGATATGVRQTLAALEGLTETAERVREQAAETLWDRGLAAGTAVLLAATRAAHRALDDHYMDV